MECLECGSTRVEKLTLYRCPDCGVEVVRTKRKEFEMQYTSNIPMTPQDVAKSVEPDPQNDEICQLRADLARVTAERDRLREGIILMSSRIEHIMPGVKHGFSPYFYEKLFTTLVEIAAQALESEDTNV